MLEQHPCFKFLLLTLVFVATAVGYPALAADLTTELLIIGGGASGTAAAIQASRMGVKTLLVEETSWLGGMLSSAGVSAIDGNHNMPSGIWGEFRQKLYDHYGGPKAVETGWVSNTLYEPAVANKLLQEMARNPNLTILYQTEWRDIKRTGEIWTTVVNNKAGKSTIHSKLIIDATELGDVMAYLKIPYLLGMDGKENIGEPIGSEKANDIIQDLTYVVTLKDYGKNADKTIAKPKNYNAAEFDCSCQKKSLATSDATTQSDCDKMLGYGKLPNKKYMINWPKCGNDYYVNLIEMDKKSRLTAIKEAKLHSLRFIYYIQNELGYKNLGLAENEYPTADNLPMIPYYRESRRLQGKVMLRVNDLINPYQQKTALYRTGIAVGDYPIDHHHAKNPDAPKIDFIKIKVPSYNVPLGALVPQNTEGIIVAEKSISASNIVAGATRLQPVVLGVGQAAGALAAVAIKSNQPISRINIREVQSSLISSKAYIMPYIDVKPEDKNFIQIQRIGATGLLKGTGINYKWANQTWFYPEQEINEWELVEGFKSFYPQLEEIFPSGKFVDAEFCAKLLAAAARKNITTADITDYLKSQGIISDYKQKDYLSRRSIAVLIDHFLNPFTQAVDFEGNLSFAE